MVAHNAKFDISFVDMASISNDGYIELKTDKFLGDLRKGSYSYFAENDIIIAKITPCMENGKCAIAKKLTNGIGMGSSEFHVFRIDNKYSTEYVFAFSTISLDEYFQSCVSIFQSQILYPAFLLLLCYL